jgi:hypothetical protein
MKLSGLKKNLGTVYLIMEIELADFLVLILFNFQGLRILKAVERNVS